ncbi:unnamed protein product [Rhizoctonia solani]|uniref:Catalase core domain-containing protein n=1 Tax=Rhizoctonia solani TaxID=456999 RepID=A0A8H3DZ13_9AGAM|nr:unnamed protein product [Rhizoctonia solani]
MTSFIQETLSKLPGVDPRVAQRNQAFSGLNDGPAATASRLAGLVQESHAKDDSPIYTSNFGQPLHDSAHALNIGGIPYQGDALMLEKQQAFDRGKIVERIVHPCGSSAFGYFQVTGDVSHLTKAAFLQPGKKTPAYTRFSTVTYGREFPDSARNPRGFATKFYTEEGECSRSHFIQIELNQIALDAAKSSVVFTLTEEVASPGKAALDSFVNQVFKKVPQDHGRELLDRIQAVGLEDIKGVLKARVLPLFDPETSIAVVASAASKSSDIADGLRSSGFDVVVSTLDSSGDESTEDSD